MKNNSVQIIVLLLIVVGLLFLILNKPTNTNTSNSEQRRESQTMDQISKDILGMWKNAESENIFAIMINGEMREFSQLGAEGIEWNYALSDSFESDSKKLKGLFMTKTLEGKTDNYEITSFSRSFFEMVNLENDQEILRFNNLNAN